MCGVAGIYHYAEPERPVDTALLVRMTRALAHRGPDDEGYVVRGPLGLGHRRLSIVDLSPTGQQPMATTDGRHWIAYNGEFYEHARHRPGLAARGVRFRGSSDTETLLYLLREHGPGALAGTSGIYALAYWDEPARRLALVRDALGVKQLYYHDDGRRLLFASEIKALLQCPEVPRALDAEAMSQYLHFHTPLFERTFLRGVRQVRAGCYLTVDRHGAREYSYWNISRFAAAPDPDARVRELKTALAEVVSDQLLADVPVGAFFSGGIDSSAVTAFAARAGRPPRCFGVHFSNQQGVVDERPFQEAAAKALGVELELTTLDGADFDTELPRLMYYQDQPVIGHALIPMYHVSRLAASRVKVCLGGQAADELFGGYARYGLADPWRVLRSWRSGRGAAGVPGATGDPRPVAVGGNLRRQLLEPRTLLRLARRVPDALDWRLRYFHNFAKVPPRMWRRLLGAPELYDRGRCWDVFAETLARSPAQDPADKVQHWDMQTYLTGLFQQDDRMSMANSLESRVPLADVRLAEFAFASGFATKFRAGATKWLLRQAVADVLPPLVLTRRKVGFDTPAEAWMKTRHRGFVRDLLLSAPARSRGVWNPAGVERLLDRPQTPLWFDAVWKMVCVETWARIFLDGAVPAGVPAVDARAPEARAMRTAEAPRESP